MLPLLLLQMSLLAAPAEDAPVGFIGLMPTDTLYETGLGPEEPLQVETFRVKQPLRLWLAKKFGAPVGEFGERRTIRVKQVEGARGLTAFVHLSDEGVRLGLVDASGKATVWTAAYRAFTHTALVAFAVPGRPAEVLVCLAVDCSEPEEGGCRKAQAGERERQCAWLAPSCPGAPGVGLSGRFSRVERSGKALFAEVFSDQPICLLEGQPALRWVRRSQYITSWGPEWAFRGELEPGECVAPTWRRLTELLMWTYEPGGLVRARDLPACGADAGAAP
ncbi:MAG: hypothetical protein Q8N23_37095 [Archangium sp.]|nr:hypothetical protein [Archangium sp.]MDP3158350.1 hypothetical protein [Archangium sp.]MDP3569559.1 hypothetical protein [Archangium sp.]